MKTRFALGGLIIGMSFLVACSPNKFSISADCKTSGSTSCISSNGQAQYSGSFAVKGGKLDILIVNDNSASMSYEQRQLATRFGNLISSMDSRLIDYRIAMTTTDISSAKNAPRAINGNGALQDGKLITFSNGKAFLSSDEGDFNSRSTAFAQAIQRPETISCENFITSWKAAGKSTETEEYSNAYTVNCPSTDERGIYAARLSLENGSTFLRGDADLAVIFLADEDVRSQLYYYNTPGYALEDKDKSSSFVSFINSKFPEKKVGVHSIITTSQACLATQGSQLGGSVSGSYGWEYYNTSMAARTKGVVGDICSSDYSGIMNSIFTAITVNTTDKIALSCSNPTGLQVTTTPSGISGSVVGSAYVFSQKLPVGTQVSFQYTCGSSSQ